MAEVYRMKAAGHWAGEKCIVKKCTNYARFVLSPFNTTSMGIGVCGHHQSSATKGLFALERKAVVCQEVPGNWGKELVVFDGVVSYLPPADRV